MTLILKFICCAGYTCNACDCFSSSFLVILSCATFHHPPPAPLLALGRGSTCMSSCIALYPWTDQFPHVQRDFTKEGRRKIGAWLRSGLVLNKAHPTPPPPTIFQADPFLKSECQSKGVNSGSKKPVQWDRAWHWCYGGCLWALATWPGEVLTPADTSQFGCATKSSVCAAGSWKGPLG